LLVSVDLSAAFDTIDHSLLLSRICHSFGVQGLALKWLNSYLRDRCQTVHIGSVSSSPVFITSGVPQGSVLGPILFSLYVSPIGQIAASHGLSHQQYADDTQLFISLSTANLSDSVSSLNSCLSGLHYWFSVHGMSLNPSKSEAILFGTQQRLRTFPNLPSVEFNGTILHLADKIRTLGVILDSSLTFDSYISSVCKSSYYYIKAIRHVRSSLPLDVCSTIATAFVQSRLDYANSILFNCGQLHLNRLQRVQNTLARVVSPGLPSEPVANKLRSLHWLPVHHRINFKIATLTYKLLSSGHPGYLSSLITRHQPVRLLRSSGQEFLSVPHVNTNFGRRAFSYSSPTVWNSIPLHIRQSSSLNTFKTQLKTFYFNIN